MALTQEDQDALNAANGVNVSGSPDDRDEAAAAAAQTVVNQSGSPDDRDANNANSDTAANTTTADVANQSGSPDDRDANNANSDTTTADAGATGRGQAADTTTANDSGSPDDRDNSVSDLYNAWNNTQGQSQSNTSAATADPVNDTSNMSWAQFDDWVNSAVPADSAATPDSLGLATRTVQTVPVDANGNPVGADLTALNDLSQAAQDQAGVTGATGQTFTAADGSTWVLNPDGTYSDVSLVGGAAPGKTNRDGSVTVTNPTDGSTVTTYPDGRVVTTGADGNVSIAAPTGVFGTDQLAPSAEAGIVSTELNDPLAGPSPADNGPVSPEQAAADTAFVQSGDDGVAGNVAAVPPNTDPSAWDTIVQNVGDNTVGGKLVSLLFPDAGKAVSDWFKGIDDGTGGTNVAAAEPADWWTQVSTTSGYVDPNSGVALGTPKNNPAVPAAFVDLNGNGIDDSLEVPVPASGDGTVVTPANPVAVFPPSTYRPGIDPQWDYYPAMKNGGVVGYADGGIAAAAAPSPQSQPLSGMDPRVSLIADTEQALARIVPGQMPASQDVAVLKQFVAKFGENALQKLNEQVKQGKFMKGAPAAPAQGGIAAAPGSAPSAGIAAAAPDSAVMMARGGSVGSTAPRLVQGAGGPKSDSIPARINGVQEARLSNGEFVVPADVVSAIGQGDPMTGAARLQELSDRLSKRPSSRAVNVEHVGG